MNKKFTLTMFVLFSCNPKAHDVEAAMASLSTDELAVDVEVLSSDAFEGRLVIRRFQRLTNQGSFLDVPLQQTSINREIGALTGHFHCFLIRRWQI